MILCYFSYIFTYGNSFGSIVKFRQDGIIFQEGPVEIRLFLDNDTTIRIVSYTTPHSDAPLLLGTYTYEIMIVIENVLSTSSIFYKVTKTYL